MTERDVENAVQAFLGGSDDQETTIFLSLTQKEACLIHLMSVLGIKTLHTTSKMAKEGFPTEVTKAALSLEEQAVRCDVELWKKILGAIRVQILGQDG